jgi:predicted metal-dependent hydrolase
MMHALLSEGINFFNEGRFFEAHEVWEDLWRDSGGPLRLFYQGLVQAAVGLHHLSHGNLDGARSVLHRATEKLEQYPPVFCGVDNAGLVTDLEKALREMTPQSIRIVRLE